MSIFKVLFESDLVTNPVGLIREIIFNLEETDDSKKASFRQWGLSDIGDNLVSPTS